jgi:hypothetical protein
MNLTFTQDLRERLRSEGAPVPVVDEQTQQKYYLISADQFEAIRPLLADVPFQPRELYPLTAKTAAAAGWENPVMDDYDRYDELHREN